MKNKFLPVLSLLVLLPLAANADPLASAMSSAGKLKYTPSPVQTALPSYSLSGPQANLANVVKTVMHGTVTISVEATVRGPSGVLNPPNLMDILMGKKPADPKSIVNKKVGGTGSGFIVGQDSEGRALIITNAHVVDAIGRGGKSMAATSDGQPVPVDVVSASIIVQTPGGSKYSASLIGFSDEANGYDLALLRLNKACKNCEVLQMDNANDAQVGESVIAIGAPLGLGNTATFGHVSANRSIHVGLSALTGGEYIQTDAAINPGNSGGPLINTSGQVVGVDEWIVSPGGGGSIGLGFAIPVRFVEEMLARYQKTGTFNSADDGLAVKNDGMGDLQITGLSKDFKSQGLQAGDIISSVDGHAFKTQIDLRRYLADKAPGEKAVFNVSRNASSKAVTVTMRTMTQSPADILNAGN